MTKQVHTVVLLSPQNDVKIESLVNMSYSGGHVLSPSTTPRSLK